MRAGLGCKVRNSPKKAAKLAWNGAGVVVVVLEWGTPRPLPFGAVRRYNFLTVPLGCREIFLVLV